MFGDMRVKVRTLKKMLLYCLEVEKEGKVEADVKVDVRMEVQFEVEVEIEDEVEIEGGEGEVEG